MAGKLCTGSTTNNAYLLKETKAFSEGIYYRAQGTAVAFPITDNPHPVGSQAADSWDLGWNRANTFAPGVIPQSSAPCVAVPSDPIEI